MHIKSTESGSSAILALAGQFNFSAHQAFRNACDGVLARPGVDQVVVDLSGVDYVDSSALGMLLQLREKAERAGRPVVLKGARGVVQQVLKIARFDTIFAPAAPTA